MTDKIIRIHLPPALHAALKVRAAQDGTTMQAFIDQLLKAALRKGGR